MNKSDEIILKADGLAKGFHFEDEKIQVLENIQLVLEVGKSISIRGNSGCGKTTLLNLLSRLESADRGTIYWGEFKIDASLPCSSNEGVRRANFLGVVYQAYYLIPELNVLENVLMASKLAGSDLRALLKEQGSCSIKWAWVIRKSRYQQNYLAGKGKGLPSLVP